MKKKGKVTIYDVARHSGLSPKTVSRVINGSVNVTDATRQKVESSIAVLDYTPNLVARGLRAEKSKRIGVVTLNAEHPVRIRAMELEARKLDYTLAFYSIDPNDEQDFVKTFKTIHAQMIDGLAVITPHTFITYEHIQEHAQDIPIVLINSYINPKIPSVIYDQEHGTRSATEHLLALGHRHICEISGPIETRINAKLRHETFLKTMQQHGIPNPVVAGVNFADRTGYDAVDQLLNDGVEFTALVCVNDRTALEAIQRLRHEGLQIPQDVSVVGYDDNYYASFLYTPLTTVRQDFDLLARTAIAYLGELLESDNPSLNQKVLIPEFIIRESTASITQQ